MAKTPALLPSPFPPSPFSSFYVIRQSGWVKEGWKVDRRGDGETRGIGVGVTWVGMFQESVSKGWQVWVKVHLWWRGLNLGVNESASHSHSLRYAPFGLAAFSAPASRPEHLFALVRCWWSTGGCLHS